MPHSRRASNRHGVALRSRRLIVNSSAIATSAQKLRSATRRRMLWSSCEMSPAPFVRNAAVPCRPQRFRHRRRAIERREVLVVHVECDDPGLAALHGRRHRQAGERAVLCACFMTGYISARTKLM